VIGLMLTITKFVIKKKWLNFLNCQKILNLVWEVMDETPEAQKGQAS